MNGKAVAMSTPVGFVFAPTEEHIMGFYMKHLVEGSPLPSMVHNKLIHGIDIYGSRPPWEIAATLPEEQRYNFYIFTKIKKLTKGRTRRTPEDGRGTWKGQKVDGGIVGSRWGASVVGEKRYLSFTVNDSKTPGEVNMYASGWNMDEYSALEIDGKPVSDDAEGRRWVICHVRYNKKKKDNSCAVQEGEMMIVAHNHHQPQLTAYSQLQFGVGQHNGVVAMQSSNMFAANQDVMSAHIGGIQEQQLVAASQPQYGASESWNMYGANKDVVSTNIGAIQDDDQQQFVAASQPTTALEEPQQQYMDDPSMVYDEFMALLNEKDENQSQGNGGDQYHPQTSDNAARNPNDQVTNQSSSYNADEWQYYQHLLDDPAAAVEAEKERLKQQGLM